MKDKLIRCIVNGKLQNLTPSAYKIARRFYGAVSEEEVASRKPEELKRPLMKPVIIKPPMKEPEMAKPPEGDPKAESIVADAAPITSGDPKVTETPRTPAPELKPKTEKKPARKTARK